MRFPSLLAPAVAALFLASCATSPERMEKIGLNEKAMNDPLEKTNRQLFALNKDLDRYVAKPVTRGYRRVIPTAAQRGVSGYYLNAKEMLNLPNALAQGKVKSAFVAADRLLINGILGLGLTDHASNLGVYTEPHDFGQTMAVWGMPSGPYLMLPFLGPSTLRDGIGRAVDFFLDPTSFILDTMISTEWHIAEMGVQLIDMRSRLMDTGEQVLTGAADEYATMRSAWLQLRRYELFDGMPPPEAEDDYDDDYDEEDDAPSPAQEPQP